LVALFLSLTAYAGHCQPAETEVFGCEVKGGKHLSVCQSKDSPVVVQYRFGRLGAIELAYPKDTSSSTRLFQLIEQSYVSSMATNLSFTNDGHVFGVFEQMGSGAASNGAGVTIEKGGKVLATVSCTGPVTSDWHTLRPHVNTGGPVDPLRGFSAHQICMDDALLLSKHSFDSLVSDFRSICCVPGALGSDHLQCSGQWPFGSEQVCEIYDAYALKIRGYHGKPRVNSAQGEPWYAPRGDYSDSWLTPAAKANIAVLEKRRDAKVGCTVFETEGPP
jgi:hypothetical protein